MKKLHPCANCPYEDLCEEGKFKEEDCGEYAKWYSKSLEKSLSKLTSTYRRTLKSRDLWKQKYLELKKSIKKEVTKWVPLHKSQKEKE